MVFDVALPHKSGGGAEIPTKRLMELVGQALRNRFRNEPAKQNALNRGDRITMACPYCGDSYKDLKKKRGNMYFASYHFKCYNGGCERYTDLLSLLEDYGVAVTDDERSVMRNIIGHARERSAELRTHRNEVAFEALFDEQLKDAMINRQELMDTLGLREIESWSTIGNYLTKRLQKIDKRFAWDWKYKRLFIFNTNQSGDLVLGLQTRKFESKPGANKYLTYKLSDIYEKFLKREVTEVVNRYDHISLLFGVLQLDYADMVTIFEGPLDSFLYHNSAATASINNPWPFDMENKRYFQDNDDSGRAKAMELVQAGESVFMWSKFLKDKDLVGRKLKDLNDLKVYEVAHGIDLGLSNLSSYFTSHKLDCVFI